MNGCLIVVEGQTEERFVKDILAPHFSDFGMSMTPTIVVTRRVKDGANFKGGINSFNQFKEHLQRVLRGAGPALVTTMVDYYGLPADFPGMSSRPPGTPRQRVMHVEKAMRNEFAAHDNLLPFIALHEFEAWLFSDSTSVPRVMTSPDKGIAFPALASGLFPEDINEHPSTAPSKRLLSMFPGYRKALHGPTAAELIGLPVIRAKCPHFAGWIAQLEMFART